MGDTTVITIFRVIGLGARVHQGVNLVAKLVCGQPGMYGWPQGQWVCTWCGQEGYGIDHWLAYQDCFVDSYLYVK